MRRFLQRLGVGPRGLILCALLGVLVGIGSYTFGYAKGGSYFSSDPRACVNCHIMREPYDSWQHASHHAVATCVDCHDPGTTQLRVTRPGFLRG
jgi:cytochrome c nitrite reductase small subunit